MREKLLDPKDAVLRFSIMVLGDRTRYDSAHTASLCYLLARGVYQRRIALGQVSPETSGGRSSSFKNYLERLECDGIFPAWVVLSGAPVLLLTVRQNLAMAKELTS